MRHGFRLFAQTLLLTDVCLQSGERRQQFLRASLTSVFASDLRLLSLARGFVAPTVRLAFDHLVDLLSSGVVLAEHFHDEGCNVAAKECRGAEKSTVRARRGREKAEFGKAEEKDSGVLSGVLPPIAVVS